MSQSSIADEPNLPVRIVVAILGISIFALLHFVAGFIAFLISFSLGMDRFDNDGDPSAVEKVCDVAVMILWFPGLQIGTTNRISNDFFEWVLLIGTSLLWGVALFAACVGGLRVCGVGPIKWIGQFSLRSLLIFTTLTAISLGIIGLLVQALK